MRTPKFHRKPGRSNESRPYTALAALYDQIMTHVDYDRWAAYLHSLISRYADHPQRVLELGCGTGNITYRLHDSLQCQYLATDISEEMLDVARTKAPSDREGLSFQSLDFRLLDIRDTFDVIVLAYDGINYLLEKDEVARLFESAASILEPGGLFLFDQSTPANSVNNLAYFDDRWKSDGMSYVRKSRYDEDRRLHITRFDVRIGGRRMREIHLQRAYDREEMELMLKLSSLRVESCFDAFSVVPATCESERVQWVLSKPHPTD